MALKKRIVDFLYTKIPDFLYKLIRDILTVPTSVAWSSFHLLVPLEKGQNYSDYEQLMALRAIHPISEKREKTLLENWSASTSVEYIFNAFGIRYHPGYSYLFTKVLCEPSNLSLNHRFVFGNSIWHLRNKSCRKGQDYKRARNHWYDTRSIWSALGAYHRYTMTDYWKNIDPNRPKTFHSLNERILVYPFNWIKNDTDGAGLEKQAWKRFTYFKLWL